MSSSRAAWNSSGYIDPCLPSPAPGAVVGPGWLHEIKHDGFRTMVCAAAGRVRLFTRGGCDSAERFPAIAAAAARLEAKSFVIDGELVCCGEDGVADFEMLRSGRNDGAAFVYAFDLLMLDGEDLREVAIEQRKALLARLLHRADPGLAYVEHVEDDGPAIFRAACQMGLEGIVSKRKGSRYISGRCIEWREIKNPVCNAVRRKQEEAWGKFGCGS